jgi:hypothetical protein
VLILSAHLREKIGADLKTSVPNPEYLVLVLGRSVNCMPLFLGLKCYVCDGVCKGVSMGELKDCSELSYAGLKIKFWIEITPLKCQISNL